MLAFPPLHPEQLKKFEPEERARLRALQPGGPLAKPFFSHRNTVLVVGSNLFVHGGVAPEHVETGLSQLNKEVSHWVRLGRYPAKQPGCIASGAGLVWSRAYSHENPAKCKCEQLEAVLRASNLSRIIMGHTIQHLGLNTSCNVSRCCVSLFLTVPQGKAVRIDVGLSRGCTDGKPQALLIEHDHIMQTLE